MPDSISAKKSDKGSEVHAIWIRTNAYGIAAMTAKDTLAKNLNTLMAQQRPGLSTITGLEEATSRHGCRVGKSTIDRMRHAATPVNLDYIEAIAAVFGFDPWQLLVPDLDPNNPPMLTSAATVVREILRNHQHTSTAVAADSQQAGWVKPKP